MADSTVTALAGKLQRIRTVANEWRQPESQFKYAAGELVTILDDITQPA